MHPIPSAIETRIGCLSTGLLNPSISREQGAVKPGNKTLTQVSIFPVRKQASACSGLSTHSNAESGLIQTFLREDILSTKTRILFLFRFGAQNSFVYLEGTQSTFMSLINIRSLIYTATRLQHGGYTTKALLYMFQKKFKTSRFCAHTDRLISKHKLFFFP